MKSKLIFLICLICGFNSLNAQSSKDMQKALSFLVEAEKLYEQKKYNEANSKLIQSEKLAKGESAKTQELRTKINSAITEEKIAKEEARSKAEQVERKRNHDEKLKEADFALKQNDFDLAIQKIEEANEYIRFSSESNALKRKINTAKQNYEANLLLNKAIIEERNGNLDNAIGLYIEANQTLKKSDLHEKIWELEEKMDKKNLFELSLNYAYKAYDRADYLSTIFWINRSKKIFPVSDADNELITKSNFYIHFNNAVDLYNHRAYDMADSVLNLATPHTFDSDSKQKIIIYRQMIEDRKTYFVTVKLPREAYKKREFKLATNLYEDLKEKYGLEPLDSLFYVNSRSRYLSQYDIFTMSINNSQTNMSLYKRKILHNKIGAWPTLLVGVAGMATSAYLISEGVQFDDDEAFAIGITSGFLSLAATGFAIHMFDRASLYKHKYKKSRQHYNNSINQRQNIAFYNKTISTHRYYCVGLYYRF